MCTPSTLRSAQQFDLPAAASKTAPAIDVRLDRATVAGLESVRLVAGVDDLDAELVPKNARVVEKRLPSSEGVEVGAADADAMHAHQRLARLCGRRGHVGGNKVTRSFESDLLQRPLRAVSLTWLPVYIASNTATTGP